MCFQMRRVLWVAESIRGLSDLVFNGKFVEKVVTFKRRWEKDIPIFLWNIKEENDFHIPQEDAMKEYVIFFLPWSITVQWLCGSN